jgi:ribosomal protein S18 acetylase RimI-like enzyme
LLVRAAAGRADPHCVPVPHPSIEIHRARPEQLTDVQRLAGVIWRAHYPGIITFEQIEYMLARGYALDALAHFLGGTDRGLELATVEGELCGFAAWYTTDEPATAKLDKLYVLPQWQRSGVGGALIGHVEGLARQAGAAVLVLNVNKHNDQAIRAYQRHGFAVRDAVVVDIGEGFVMDDYVMEKRIAVG